MIKVWDEITGLMHPAEYQRQWRRLLWEKYERRCGICGEPLEFDAMQVDHIVSRRRGGDDSWGNMQPSHQSCNARKGEWTHTRGASEPPRSRETPSRKNGPRFAERGQRSRRAKLTEAAVIEMRRRYACGESVPTLAVAYNAAVSTIYAVIRRSTWCHIP